MDSEDEFDSEVDRIPEMMRSSALTGFQMSQTYQARQNAVNPEQKIDQTVPQFNIDEDDEELRACNMIPRKHYQAKYTRAQLVEELYKDYMTQDFNNLRIREDNESMEGVPFEEQARRMDPITEDGGIKKKVVVNGRGGKIKVGQVVYIDYLITFEAGDETLRTEQVVDSTKNMDGLNEPYRFKVGVGNVLHVLDIGVLTMAPFESAKFLATYQYAYGKLGLYQEVPPKTTIMVEIVIKKVVDGCENLKVWEMDADDRAMLSVDQRITAGEELKTYGNDLFKRHKYQQARMKYKQALKIITEILTPVKAELDKITQMLFFMYNNIAQCRMKEGEFRRAQYYLDEAVKLDLTDLKKLKAYYRLAICHCEQSEFDTATKFIDLAKSLDASNQDIEDLYRKLHEKKLEDMKKEKAYSKMMFK